MKTLVTGRGLVESPRWYGGRLLFADWTAGEILAVEPDGSTSVVVRHASLPLCFDHLPDGTMLVVSGPQRALMRAGADGVLMTYADLSALSEYECNDIVADGRGNAYVNNGNFDFAAGPPAGPVAPGFVALARPDGTVEIVADDIAFPNGMAVTPDNATLIVADSYRHCLVGFDIAADGTLSARRVWADLGEDAPDGICIDADGAVWYADVPHQHCRRVREGGEVLDTVQLDRGGFSCTLDDAATLYVVAARWPGMDKLADAVAWEGQVLSTPAPASGAGWPGRG